MGRGRCQSRPVADRRSPHVARGGVAIKDFRAEGGEVNGDDDERTRAHQSSIIECCLNRSTCVPLLLRVFLSGGWEKRQLVPMRAPRLTVPISDEGKHDLGVQLRCF
jgi:hypothetical protein